MSVVPFDLQLTPTSSTLKRDILLFQEFQTFLSDHKFIDLSIFSINSNIACHSLMLAAASPALSAILSEAADTNPDLQELALIIPDIPSHYLEQIIHAIYHPDDTSIDPEIFKWMSFLGIKYSTEDDVDEDLLLDEKALLSSLLPVVDSSVDAQCNLLSNLLPVVTSVNVTPCLSPLLLQDEEDVEEPLLASTKYRKDKESLLQPSFNCERCPKKFPTRLRLDLHRQQSHGVPRRTLTLSDLSCDKCDYAAKSTTALEVHRNNHSGLKPFSCEHCGKTFASESYLEQHVHTHNSIKIHACNLCPKTFQSLPSLSQHKQTHDQTANLWQCPQCQKTFKTQRYLYQHTQRRHRSVAIHQCSICEKILSGKEELSSHMRIHTGEKPLSCHVCSASFRFRSTLNTHLRAHRNDRRFRCDFCAKGFIQLADLKKHERTHTNEKPYGCEVCGKRFARSDYKTKHMRTHNRVSSMTTARQEVVMDIPVDMEEEMSVNALLLGDGIPSEAVELDSLGPEEPMQLVLEDTGHAADWLKMQQNSGQLVVWEKSGSETKN